MKLSIAATGRRAQRGQALLIMMLFVVMAGAALLLDGVNSAAQNRGDIDARTTRALADAKAALMAYAVTDANRPGELPCPDIDHDGDAGLPEYAGSNCTSLRGWLPWRTLDMIDSDDGSGSRLWYAVSDAFHAADAGALNPDTVGGVSVDAGAAGDVVAVIIAPGEALGAQGRPGTGHDAATHVGEYLEGVNADADLTTYVSTAGGTFNDRVAYITATELLRATERRVLGEVAAALTAYRQANGAYPWLSPFDDPYSGSAALYDGVPGTRFGHLPFVDATEVGETQDTGYTITWTEGDAPVSTVGTDSPSDGSFSVDGTDLGRMQADALANIAAGSITFPTPSVPTGGNPSCDWQGSAAVADCVGSVAGTNAGYVVTVTLDIPPFINIVYPNSPVARDYTFDVSYTGNAALGAHSGGVGHGVRDVDSGAVFQAFPTGSVSTVTIRDYVVGLPGISVTRRLSITDGNTAVLDINNIYLEPSTNATYAGDLPPWFFTQQWERFVLAEYADNALPGESLAAGTACTPGAACVNLDIRNAAGGVGLTRNDLFAVVVGAGTAIAGVQNRTVGATLTDFFEQTNAVEADGLAERRVLSSAWTFNDQVRIVEPGPLP